MLVCIVCFTTEGYILVDCLSVLLCASSRTHSLLSLLNLASRSPLWTARSCALHFARSSRLVSLSLFLSVAVSTLVAFSRLVSLCLSLCACLAVLSASRVRLFVLAHLRRVGGLRSSHGAVHFLCGMARSFRRWDHRRCLALFNLVGVLDPERRRWWWRKSV